MTFDPTAGGSISKVVFMKNFYTVSCIYKVTRVNWGTTGRCAKGASPSSDTARVRIRLGLCCEKLPFQRHPHRLWSYKPRLRNHLQHISFSVFNRNITTAHAAEHVSAPT